MIYCSRLSIKSGIYRCFPILVGCSVIYLMLNFVSNEEPSSLYCSNDQSDPNVISSNSIQNLDYIRQCSFENIHACQKISNRSLLFRLDGRAGFTSEINNLIRAFVYAVHTRRKLVIDDRYWNYGPFSSLFDIAQGHFSPWLPSSPYCHNRTFVHFRQYQRYNHTIPQHLVIDRDYAGGFLTLNAMMKPFENNSDILHQKRVLVRYLWNTLNHETRSFMEHFVREIQVDSIDYGMHIRRGDKLLMEAKLIPLQEYIEAVEYALDIEGKSDLRPRIFVSSDQFNLIEQLRSMKPGWIFVQIPSLQKFQTINAKGHMQGEFNQLTPQSKLELTRLLITELEILSRIKYVICTFSSNICRFVQTLRSQNPDTVLSLDTHWYPQ